MSVLGLTFPRLLAGLLLPVAMGLSACVTTDTEPDGPSEATQRMAQWQVCVGTATGTNRRTMTDANMAVELAFIACQTEENAILALFSDFDGRDQAAQIIAEHKATMKADLISLKLGEHG